MSFNPTAALLVAAAREHLPASPTAIDLGNQRFKVGRMMLDRLCGHFSVASNTSVDLHQLKALLQMSEDDGIGRVDLFYKALGFRSYNAIDVNENFGSVVMDLNRLLVEDYNFTQKFDLVMNNGTGEHIFNQFAVFKNIHDLCREGGLMLHIMPFINYLNHGFYNFHPVLYCDVAAANDYGLEAIGIGNRWGDLQVLSGNLRSPLLPRCEFPLETVRRSIRGVSHRRPALRLRLRQGISRLLGRWAPPAEPWRGLERRVIDMVASTARRDETRLPNLIVFALLRQRRNSPFRMPFQGKYLGAIKDGQIRSVYAV